MNENHTSSRWSYLRLWAELLAASWRLQPGRTAAMFAVRTVQTGLVAANALALSATVAGMSSGDPVAAGIGAVSLATAVAVGQYMRLLANILRIVLVEQVGLLHLNRRIQSDIVSLEGLDHLERAEFLDRVTVVRGSAWALVFGMWNAVDSAFNIVNLALLLVLLGSVNPWLSLLLPIAAAAIWCDRRGLRAVSAAEVATAESNRLQRHLFEVATGPAGGKEIRVTGAAAMLATRQAQAWEDLVRGRFRARMQAAGWKLTGWTLFTAGFAAGLALVVHQTAQGTSTVGDLVLAITVAVSVRDSVQDTLIGVNESMSSGRLIDPYLWLRDYVAGERARVVGRLSVPPELRDGITLDRLSYTYPGTERRALDEVSHHIPAGTVVAVVGDYGSGKTTLVKLLAKFHRPDSGAILVDGVDLSRLDTTEWRARASAVFQDFGRFHIRFAETVGLGDLPHLENTERIIAAVRTADAGQLVSRLPDGLDTHLGREFGGVDLSEGQWQKTALARASMRTNPLLFVLDEPTASLDAPSEHAIFERYMVRAHELAARTGAVTVIVSHRFSTVAGADLILVLEQGRLVESGSHEQLLAMAGRYAQLYGIQAAAYSAEGFLR